MSTLSGIQVQTSISMFYAAAANGTGMVLLEDLKATVYAHLAGCTVTMIYKMD